MISNSNFRTYIGAESWTYDPEQGRIFLADGEQKKNDALNAWICSTFNNGAYRSGFTITQESYEEAVIPLFESLHRLEELLSKQRFLCGDKLTEADVRPFPILVRFDTVYVSYFKCALKRIRDYPNLWGYTRDICQLSGIADTVNIEYNKAHYYGNHDTEPYTDYPYWA